MDLLPPLWIKYKGYFAITVALLVLIGAAAVWGNRGLLHRAELQTQLRELEELALRLERRNDDLRTHLRRLRSDRSYLERVVRERLGWVKDDEILYRFPSTPARRRSSIAETEDE